MCVCVREGSTAKVGGGWVRKGANGTVQPSMEDWFGVHNCRCDVRFRGFPASTVWLLPNHSHCQASPCPPSDHAYTKGKWIINPCSCEPFHAPHTPQEKASKKLTIENPRLNSKTKQKSYNTPLQPDGTLQPSKKTTKRTRKELAEPLPILGNNTTSQPIRRLFLYSPLHLTNYITTTTPLPIMPIPV